MRPPEVVGDHQATARVIQKLATPAPGTDPKHTSAFWVATRMNIPLERAKAMLGSVVSPPV